MTPGRKAIVGGTAAAAGLGLGVGAGALTPPPAAQAEAAGNPAAPTPASPPGSDPIAEKMGPGSQAQEGGAPPIGLPAGPPPPPAAGPGGPPIGNPPAPDAGGDFGGSGGDYGETPPAPGAPPGAPQSAAPGTPLGAAPGAAPGAAQGAPPPQAVAQAKQQEQTPQGQAQAIQNLAKEAPPGVEPWSWAKEMWNKIPEGARWPLILGLGMGAMSMMSGATGNGGPLGGGMGSMLGLGGLLAGGYGAYRSGMLDNMLPKDWQYGTQVNTGIGRYLAGKGVDAVSGAIQHPGQAMAQLNPASWLNKLSPMQSGLGAAAGGAAPGGGAPPGGGGSPQQQVEQLMQQKGLSMDQATDMLMQGGQGGAAQRPFQPTPEAPRPVTQAAPQAALPAPQYSDLTKKVREMQGQGASPTAVNQMVRDWLTRGDPSGKAPSDEYVRSTMRQVEREVETPELRQRIALREGLRPENIGQRLIDIERKRTQYQYHRNQLAEARGEKPEQITDSAIQRQIAASESEPNFMSHLEPYKQMAGTTAAHAAANRGLALAKNRAVGQLPASLTAKAGLPKVMGSLAGRLVGKLPLVNAGMDLADRHNLLPTWAGGEDTGAYNTKLHEDRLRAMTDAAKARWNQARTGEGSTSGEHENWQGHMDAAIGMTGDQARSRLADPNVSMADKARLVGRIGKAGIWDTNPGWGAIGFPAAAAMTAWDRPLTTLEMAKNNLWGR
jgi:hypothetical protein